MLYRSIFQRAILSMALISITGPVMAERGSYPKVTHGAVIGDVRADSAVIWSRTNKKSYMHVQVVSKNGGKALHKTLPVVAKDDYTGKIFLSGLKSDTEYNYRVWFSDSPKGQAGRQYAFKGTFITAPAASEKDAVTFAWGGDLAGQNVCRDKEEGFPIFKAVNEIDPDFFIGLGDMIYADNACESLGRYGNAQVPGNFLPAATMRDYWAHWKYNRAEKNFQTMLANTPYYAIWDDHEVVNDFGPLHDTRSTPPYTAGVHLMPMGLDAFLDYNPVKVDAATPDRLYRNVRWGKHLEMFILDNRQYRDSNFEDDGADRPKTMLGREQLVWLKDKLKASKATWKIIVSSVPMSIPTGAENARDGWANFSQTGGFEQELLDILKFMHSENIRNTAWITTDVHFAEVFRYTPIAGDPSFKVHEVVSGPLNAGLFPNRNFDTTLASESLFFYGPASATDITTYEQAKPWMNFGMGKIDENGRLTFSINDISGTPVYKLSLDPQ